MLNYLVLIHLLAFTVSNSLIIIIITIIIIGAGQPRLISISVILNAVSSVLLFDISLLRVSRLGQNYPPFLLLSFVGFNILVEVIRALSDGYESRKRCAKPSSKDCDYVTIVSDLKKVSQASQACPEFCNKEGQEYRIAGIFGGIKIWQIANFMWLANFNLANWQAHVIEHAHSE